MTAPPTATPTAPAHRDPAVHPATPAQLHWLEGELAHWQAEGLLDADRAQAIRGRYVASRRFTLSRIVLTLGACFVGLGLVWLVASNLDAMSPLDPVPADGRDLARPGRRVRGARRPARPRRATPRPRSSGRCGCSPPAAFGAVVFQAAQSLQVPGLRAAPRRRVGPGCTALGVCRARRRAARARRRPARLLVRLAGARAGRGRLRRVDRARRRRPGRRVGRGRATWCSAGATWPTRGARSAPSSRSSPCSSRRCPTRGAMPRAAWRSAVGLGVAVVLAGAGPRARRPRRPARGRPRRRRPWRSPSACRCGGSTRTSSTPPTCRRRVGCGPCSRWSPTSPSRAGTPCSAGCATPAGSPGSPPRRWSCS